MKQLTKERFFHKVKFWLLFAFFISLFLGFLFETQLIRILLRFDLTDYIDMADLNNHKKIMYGLLATMDQMTGAIYSVPTIVPLLVFSFSWFFYKERTEYWEFAAVRIGNYRKLVLSSLFSHVMFTAVSIFLVYLLYMNIGYFLFLQTKVLPAIFLTACLALVFPKTTLICIFY